MLKTLYTVLFLNFRLNHLMDCGEVLQTMVNRQLDLKFFPKVATLTTPNEMTESTKVRKICLWS